MNKSEESYRITSIKRPLLNAPSNKRPPPLFQNFKNKRPPLLNAPPPPKKKKGGVYLKHSVISQEKHVFTLFELLDEDIVEAAPSFNLIDEENNDEELEIL